MLMTCFSFLFNVIILLMLWFCVWRERTDVVVFQPGGISEIVEIIHEKLFDTVKDTWLKDDLF